MNTRDSHPEFENRLDRRALIAGIGGLAAGATLFAGRATAGPLSPPPGPIGSTGRTVQEIYDKIARTDVGLAEPRIPVQSLPGSATALHVISQPGSYYLTGNIVGEAGKNGIHIVTSSVDINLAGFALMGLTALNAIVATPGTRGLSIRNGMILDWTHKALSARDTKDGQLDNLVVLRCGSENPGDPYSVRCGDSWTVQSCVVSDSVRWGIGVTSGVVRDCIATGNNGQGIALVRGVLSRCVATSNPDAGLSADESCVVHECAAYFNTYGIVGGFGCLIQSNATYGNSIGIVNSRRSQIIDNTCFANGIGLDVRGGASTIRGNSVAENSGIGINVQSTENLILRNAMNGNGTNLSIVAGNSHGPIVNVAGVGDISIVAAADHPSANFVY